jgi:para-nitrobenzyl esterase
MPPVKPEPWKGIRNALHYGRVCPNQDSAHFNTDGKNLVNSDEDAFVLHRGAAATVPGEDCLRLNLWTQEINGSRKRPVMVYMHGGGFSGGSGHDLLSYDGESLARNHVSARGTRRRISISLINNENHKFGWLQGLRKSRQLIHSTLVVQPSG